MADQFLTILEKRKPEIQQMLADWITPERFFAMASLVRRNSLLRDCSDESLVECVVQAAQMGLEIGGSRGHFYCVPYGKEAQGQPGWRGLAFLKLKAGAIMQLDTDVVFKGETFKVSRSGQGDNFLHELDYGIERKEKDAVASYARVILPTGEIQFEITSRDRVQRHRAHSKQPDGMLWNPSKFWEEGWRKTPYRILDKRLPEGVNAEAIERYGRAVELEAKHYTRDVTEVDDRIKLAESANADLPDPPKQPRHANVEVVPDKKGDAPYDKTRGGWSIDGQFFTDDDLFAKWKAKGHKPSELSGFLYSHFHEKEDLTDLTSSEVPQYLEFVK